MVAYKLARFHYQHGQQDAEITTKIPFATPQSNWFCVQWKHHVHNGPGRDPNFSEAVCVRSGDHHARRTLNLVRAPSARKTAAMFWSYGCCDLVRVRNGVR